MDSNGNKPSKPVRGSLSWNVSENESPVVVEISSDVPSKEPMDSSTADGYAPTANKPPKIVKRPVHSKPKSRFGKQPCYMDSDMFEENDSSSLRDQTERSASDEQHEKEVDEDMVKMEELKKRVKKKEKAKKMMQWVGVFCITGCLVASLTVHPLKNCYLWGLKIWKWCLLATVTLCGMIITHKVMNVIVFLIERNFLLKKKVFYFVHGLKKSVRETLWLTLVLVTWLSLFDWRSHRDSRSKTTWKILDAVTWTLIALLLGSILWLVKNVSLKILASTFHVNRFFDRIQDSIFNHNVLQTLLGTSKCVTVSTAGSKKGILCFMRKTTSDIKTIGMGKIEQMKQEKVTALTMKNLVKKFKSSQISFFQQIDESYDQNFDDDADVVQVAKLAAYKIFNHIAPGKMLIETDDLLKVLEKETIERMLPQFEIDSEPRKIDRKALINWVIKVNKDMNKLAHGLDDTKTAVKQLNGILSVLIIIATAIIWLLLMGIATTKVLLLLLSQLAVLAFIFGNSCKTAFEALIFVFIVHPFDAGDYCSVDDVTRVVEEMYILTTVFLKLNNEKVYYPNSVLATKSITNYYRSPHMGDTIDFSIAFATPLEKIRIMKERIKSYLEKNPKRWHPNHSVVVKEIEDLNKLKMNLCVNHTINFQNWSSKTSRRSELVMEMKTIFEELQISYNLLPQQVHLFPVEVR